MKEIDGLTGCLIRDPKPCHLGVQGHRQNKWTNPLHSTGHPIHDRSTAVSIRTSYDSALNFATFVV